MTGEVLKQEAKESWWNDNNCSGALSTEKIYECGYLAGAEPREKRIAELEQQIEKMKCCGNCENRYGQEKCEDCHNYSKWNFKQAEQFYEEIVE